MKVQLSSRLLADEQGLTLIEISIALLIVGLMLVAVIPSIEGVTGVRAREAASKISGVVRYMYNESALSGRPCRMVFDLDARQYWAECTEGHFVMNAERERSRGGSKLDDEVAKDKLDRELSSSAGFSVDDVDQIKAEKERILKQAEFSEFTNDTVEHQKLPKGVDLAVWVDHQREKYTKGQAYLYFFPQGYTERAQLYLSSGSTTYTIQVQPLTGKAKVAAEELELPRDVR